MENVEKTEKAEKTSPTNMDRRAFLGTMGAMGVMGGMLAALQGCAPKSAGAANATEGGAEGASLASTGGQGAPGATGNPNSPYYDTFANMKDPVMTREEALEFLYNPEMATEPITLDDGTVIPAVYVNLRNRWNRIGVGIGSQVDLSADYWTKLMKIYTEEEAAQYLELPIYHPFTAAEYAEVSGRSVEECVEICDGLAMKGVLPRFTRAGVPYYYLTNQWLGGNMHAHEEEYKGGLNAADWAGTQYDCGTPIYQVVPVNADVVAETNILPLDDWKAVVERNEKFVITPCACRAGMAAAQGDFEYQQGDIWNTRLNDETGHNFRINTCLAMGELAEYYEYFGYGWPISKEDAIKSCEQSIDEGMVIEHFYGKTSEVICNCHCDCCLLLGAWRAVDGVGDCLVTISNYSLNVDKDKCIKCGTCIERCTMHSVSFGDDGFPTVDSACARCGACAVTCPAGARTLVAKPKEQRDDAPADMWEDWAEKPIYRAMKGQLYDFIG